MAATKTFANGKPRGISLLSERQQQQILDARDSGGQWLISPELLAVQFGVSTVTIYNVVRRARNKKTAPAHGVGIDPTEPHEAAPATHLAN